MRKDAPYILSVHEDSICAESGSDCLLRLGTRTASPFIRKVGRHSHPEIELALFLQGEGLYVVGKKTYDIAPGDLFLFAGGEQHCVTQITSTEGLTYRTLHFEPRFVWSSGNDLFDVRFLQIFNDRPADFCNRLPRGNVHTQEIAALMELMAEEFARKEAAYALMVKAILLRLLVLLNRHFGCPAPKEQPARLERYDAVENAMIYIHEHLGDPVTLERLAMEAHMSRAYFSTVFRRLNGISPWAYLTAYRVARAKELLRTTDLPVLDISGQCGYNSAAGFNRAFHQLTGRSPTDYRAAPDAGNL